MYNNATQNPLLKKMSYPKFFKDIKRRRNIQANVLFESRDSNDKRNEKICNIVKYKYNILRVDLIKESEVL